MRLPLQDESVDMCLTSPPYWALRKYASKPLVWDGDPECEHEWGSQVDIAPRCGYSDKSTLKGFTNPDTKLRRMAKAQACAQGQFCSPCSAWRGGLGLEPTFELFIKHLCDIFDDVKRVLKKEATCWINMGDTFASKGSEDSRWAGDGKLSKAYMGRGRTDSVLPKSLCLIPMRFAIEMCNRGWILRNVIVWHKPNCMPSSAKDRFTVDFEYIFLFTKSRRYYFEQQFEAMLDPERIYSPNVSGHKTHQLTQNGNRTTGGLHDGRTQYGDPQKGRNKRCVWTIPTEPYPEAHFATYPQTLCETPIKAGCPEFVCRKCGKGREKVLKRISGFDADGNCLACGQSRSKHHQSAKSGLRFSGSFEEDGTIPCGYGELQGYTDCGCNAGFSPGIVFDPFAGSGTTGIVCQRLGRQFIGIDLSMEYLHMAQKRMAQGVLV